MAITIGSTSIATGSDISGATNATFFFHIYCTDVTGATDQNILFESTLITHRIYIKSSKLAVSNGKSLFGNNGGTWSCDISSATEYLVAIKHQWGTDSSNPKIFLNGSSVTVTETSTPDGSGALVATPLHIGASSADTNVFGGRISEVAFWDTQLTDDQCVTLTQAKVKGLPLQVGVSNLQNYWPMDEVVDGATITSSTLYDRKGTNNLSADSGTGAAERFISYA